MAFLDMEPDLHPDSLLETCCLLQPIACLQPDTCLQNDC